MRARDEISKARSTRKLAALDSSQHSSDRARDGIKRWARVSGQASGRGRGMSDLAALALTLLDRLALGLEVLDLALKICTERHPSQLSPPPCLSDPHASPMASARQAQAHFRCKILGECRRWAKMRCSTFLLALELDDPVLHVGFALLRLQSLAHAERNAALIPVAQGRRPGSVSPKGVRATAGDPDKMRKRRVRPTHATGKRARGPVSAQSTLNLQNACTHARRSETHRVW